MSDDKSISERIEEMKERIEKQTQIITLNEVIKLIDYRIKQIIKKRKREVYDLILNELICLKEVLEESSDRLQKTR